MKQYNIYAGLFGKASYLFTGMYNSEDEALEDAYNSACDIYENRAECSGLRDFPEIVDQYCSKNNIEDLTEEDAEILFEIYYNEVDTCVEYYAIETINDNIDEEDLILGYVIEDGNSGEADSK